MVQLLELTDRPGTLGFQADMAHTLLYTLGYNAPEDRILPEKWNWDDPAKLDQALATLTAALRPWTIDFHIAQNDATVKGSGSHDKTGRHCLPDRSQRQAQDRPPRRLLAARRLRQRDQEVQARLLGRLHVPQRGDDEAADVEQHPGGDGRRARCPWVGLTLDIGTRLRLAPASAWKGHIALPTVNGR